MAEAVWIIIFIPVVMWILSSLVRGGEEEKPQPGDVRNKPSSNDLDRFLEEVNRRRQQASERQAGPPPPPEDVRRRQPAPTRRPAPPAPRPQPQRPAPAQVVKPAPRATPTPVVRAESAPSVIPVKISGLVVPILPSVRSRAIMNMRATRNPAAEQVGVILSTPAGLQAAFLLKEILGPPRCHRSP